MRSRRSHTLVVTSFAAIACVGVAAADSALVLHVADAEFGAYCTLSGADTLSCSGIEAESDGESPSFLWVLASDTDEITALQFGVAFDSTIGVSGWFECNGAMTIPSSSWPASGTGVALAWSEELEPTYNGFIPVGFFLIDAQSSGTFRLVPDPRTGEAAYVDGSAVTTVLSPSLLARAGFGEASGCRPCLEGGDACGPGGFQSGGFGGVELVLGGPDSELVQSTLLYTFEESENESGYDVDAGFLDGLLATSANASEATVVWASRRPTLAVGELRVSSVDNLTGELSRDETFNPDAGAHDTTGLGELSQPERSRTFIVPSASGNTGLVTTAATPLQALQDVALAELLPDGPPKVVSALDYGAELNAAGAVRDVAIDVVDLGGGDWIVLGQSLADDGSWYMTMARVRDFTEFPFKNAYPIFGGLTHVAGLVKRPSEAEVIAVMTREVNGNVRVARLHEDDGDILPAVNISEPGSWAVDDFVLDGQGQIVLAAHREDGPGMGVFAIAEDLSGTLWSDVMPAEGRLASLAIGDGGEFFVVGETMAVSTSSARYAARYDPQPGGTFVKTWEYIQASKYRGAATLLRACVHDPAGERLVATGYDYGRINAEAILYVVLDPATGALVVDEMFHMNYGSVGVPRHQRLTLLPSGRPVLVANVAQHKDDVVVMQFKSEAESRSSGTGDPSPAGVWHSPPIGSSLSVTFGERWPGGMIDVFDVFGRRIAHHVSRSSDRGTTHSFGPRAAGVYWMRLRGTEHRIKGVVVR